jgi:predicted acyl esterase
MAANSSCVSSIIPSEKEGWSKQPKVLLQVRHIDKFVPRAESEWPLKRTRWTNLSRSASMTLTTKKPSGNAQLRSPPWATAHIPHTTVVKETEITGPSALKLFASSSTPDADFFVVLRIFTGDLKEISRRDRSAHARCTGVAPRFHRKLDKNVQAIPALSHLMRSSRSRKGNC